MKNSVLLALMMASPVAALAQDVQTVDDLKKELRELRQRTEQLEEKLKKFETAPPPASTNAVVSTNAPVAIAAPKDSATTPTPPGFSPTAPITLFKSGPAYMNVSADALFAVGGTTASDIQNLQPGAHDPIQRGFTMQGIEATFDGAVDPFLRAQANLSLQMDRNAETEFEVEEAWAETTSLPWNLTLRGGQMFTDFGRQNQQHAHAWNFVDSPLVNARLLGPDGLRNPGARLSWLLPTPFYSEWSVSVQNSSGETASSFRFDHDGEPYLGRLNSVGNVRGPGDLLFASHYQLSFDLTPQQTLLGGISGATGPNSSSTSSDTQIYGVDLFWKWKPTTHHYGFPFVTFQTEAMLRHYQAGAFSEDFNGDGVIDTDLNGDGVIDSVPRELLKDWGFYSQVAWGFKKGWVTALRFDYLDRLHKGQYEMVYGDDPERGRRWRISPNLTWYPSEFSKIRLQYNFDERDNIGPDHSIWLQFEFLLGSHGAHKF